MAISIASQNAKVKSSKGNLEIINNSFVVQNGLMFDYYSISHEEYKPTDKFIKLRVSPAVATPGIAIIDKKLYAVSMGDLYRRRIDVSKHIRIEEEVRTEDGNSKTNGSSKRNKNAAGFKANKNQSGSGSVSGSQISKDADLAWKNQVNALLNSLYTEEGEEVEIETPSQPGSVDESRSISDIFEDIEPIECT